MRCTATVFLILASVGGALGTTVADNRAAYQASATNPCGAAGTLPAGTVVIGEDSYTSSGSASPDTFSEIQLWTDLRSAFKDLTPDTAKVANKPAGNGWTAQQHHLVKYLTKLLSPAQNSAAQLATYDNPMCKQLQADIALIGVNIDAHNLRRASTATASRGEIQKRPWHSVLAALAIAGLANTIQKY